MKLSTLLEIIGSGSVLIVVGVLMLFFGIGYGISESTQLPLWAVFGGLGVLLSIVGIALVDRGTEEAEEQVKQVQVPQIMETLRNPLFKFGAAIVGGIILQRLLRRAGPEIVVNTQPASAPPVALSAPAIEQTAPPSAKRSGFSVSHYLSEQLGTVASVASGLAVSMGMKAFGIPSVKQLMTELIGAVDPKDNPVDPTQTQTSVSAPSGEQQFRRSSTSEREFVGRPPTHNGRNSTTEYDSMLG